MAYYKKEGQMDLSDRIAIETGISNKEEVNPHVMFFHLLFYD